jgi:hypothetical protein
VKKHRKLIIGFVVSIVAIIATLISSGFTNSFNVPLTVTSQGNGFTFSTPTGELKHQNYFVPKGKLSIFSFTPAQATLMTHAGARG